VTSAARSSPTARRSLPPTTPPPHAHRRTYERGQAHDVKNLFIVDGSVFVTAGGINPTSTIQALALYIADGIKENVESVF